jgi:hypothetical protein
MQHYKNPSYHTGNEIGVGDFPSIVYSICKKFCKRESVLTIEELNKLLD